MAHRHAAVAGSFYPGNPQRLSGDIARYLAAAKPGDAPPQALIAPHAGYIYSGPVAGMAYAQLSCVREAIKRVVIIGPAHRVPVQGLALSGAETFETPLGCVPVDADAREKLIKLPQVTVRDDAHACEHCLEVQLPFLQHLLPQAWTLVPLLAGDVSAQEISDVLDALWNPPETLVVISSDLSHYMDYETAQRMDRATAQSIEALRPEELDFEQACGRLPVCGMLLQARKRHLHARLLDLRNSGDTAGDHQSVVGYGAFAFTNADHGT